jgi:hypothetical protein
MRILDEDTAVDALSDTADPTTKFGAGIGIWGAQLVAMQKSQLRRNLGMTD